MVSQPFTSDMMSALAATYPHAPRHLQHQIADHPLLQLDALAALARRLRPESIEFNAATDLPHFVLHAEICEDLWAPVPPSTYAALGGATVLGNLSASNITIGNSSSATWRIAGASQIVIHQTISLSNGSLVIVL